MVIETELKSPLPPQTPLNGTTDYTQKWFPTDEKKTI